MWSNNTGYAKIVRGNQMAVCKILDGHGNTKIFKKKSKTVNRTRGHDFTLAK